MKGSVGLEEKASVIFGEDLYRNGEPSLEIYRKRLKSLFDEWRRFGIKEVYPSTDIDGLRLDAMGYVGTDYYAPRQKQSLLASGLQHL